LHNYKELCLKIDELKNIVNGSLHCFTGTDEIKDGNSSTLKVENQPDM
jgi:hypothetical protein